MADRYVVGVISSIGSLVNWGALHFWISPIEGRRACQMFSVFFHLSVVECTSNYRRAREWLRAKKRVRRANRALHLGVRDLRYVQGGRTDIITDTWWWRFAIGVESTVCAAHFNNFLFRVDLVVRL